MRKALSPAVLLLVALLLLAACVAPTTAPAAQTGTESETGATSASGEATTTLTYMLSQGWLLEPEQELAQMFEEETGIHVDFQVIPADQYFNVLTTRLNAGEATDIFGGQSGKTDLRVLYNIEENGVDLSDQEWVSREDPLAVDQTSLDGKTYGLTIWDPGKWPVIYNKEIFAEHNLVPPTNFNEFFEICVTLRDAGINPIYEYMADGWHHVLWFPENGPRFEQATPGLTEALNNNEATFAGNPQMLSTLQGLKTLYDTGCFGPNTLSDAGSETTAKMASGEYAMVVGPISTPASIEADYPDTPASTFGFFVNPLADNTLFGVQPAGPSKFINAKSPNIDAAKQYFEFLTRPENLQYFLDNEPTFATINWPGFDSKLTEEQSAFLASVEMGTVFQVDVNYLNPQWMDIGRDMTAMFTDAMTPEQVLENVDQRRAEMAQAANDPAWSE